VLLLVDIFYIHNLRLKEINNQRKIQKYVSHM
jgi:hypothetical protein